MLIRYSTSKNGRVEKLCLGLLSYMLHKYYEQGYTDLIVSAPKEGTGYEIGTVALLKNAQIPESC